MVARICVVAVRQGQASPMPPYLLSIATLVMLPRRSAYAQALMKPYRKDER